MAFENRRLLFGVWAILTISCLLYITANVLPLWGTSDSNGVTTNVGLWAGCVKTKDTRTKCANIGGSESYANWQDYAKGIGSGVFLTIACIFSSFSILSVSLILLVNADSKKIPALLAIVFTIASLIAGIIGFALGIVLVLQKDESNHSFKMGASCFIAIVALVFNLVGVIGAFLIK